MNKAPIARRKLSSRVVLLLWFLRVYAIAAVLIVVATSLKQFMP